MIFLLIISISIFQGFLEMIYPRINNVFIIILLFLYYFYMFFFIFRIYKKIKFLPIESFFL